jgi:hypothetical protein
VIDEEFSHRDWSSLTKRKSIERATHWHLPAVRDAHSQSHGWKGFKDREIWHKVATFGKPPEGKFARGRDHRCSKMAAI